MSTPVAIRFDDALLDQVRLVARRAGTTTSTVVQTYVQEGIRADQVPGIQFRNGPGGRRPGVAGGPDVWEVIEAVKQRPAGESTALVDVAEDLGLPTRTVATALDYYGRFPDEIDQWIADNDAQAETARAAWLRRQQLVS